MNSTLSFTQSELSALRSRGAIASQIIGALHSSDVPPEMLMANADTLPSDSLPREPLDLRPHVGRLVHALRTRDFGTAEKLAAYVVYASELLANREAVPARYEQWIAGGDLSEASALKRRQNEDAARAAKLNAPATANVDWGTLTAAEQARYGNGREPGDVVKVTPGRYTQVPEPLERLLGAEIEGADTDLGQIEGLES